MSKAKPNKDENLKVQVLLAVYQSDIQTYLTYVFGLFAFLGVIFAIQFQITSWDNQFLFKVITSINISFGLFCMYQMYTVGKKFLKSRKALADLRLKYC